MPLLIFVVIIGNVDSQSKVLNICKVMIFGKISLLFVTIRVNIDAINDTKLHELITFSEFMVRSYIQYA